MTQSIRRENIPDPEWQARVQLAACYRILHRLRMTDTVNTHVAVRLPGREDRFLLNPYGLLFDEIRASNLVTVDRDGRVVGPQRSDVNAAGFSIHGAVFRARPDVVCSLHTHTRAGVAVSTLRCGLLPISQFAFYFKDRVGYHSYRHFGGSDDDCAALGADLGSNIALIMENHGLLTVGRSIPEAFLLTYYLDKACDIQIAAQGTGAELIVPPEAEMAAIAQEVDSGFSGKPFGVPEWEALTRQLDREDPSYAD
jgi:ribulose-5-phosphate 4-epimerase/fuculose-1-phosphate aldolase